MLLTRNQRVSLHEIWQRELDNPHGLTYKQFRKTVLPGSFGAVMVRWAGMWLGIETDGHVHS